MVILKKWFYSISLILMNLTYTEQVVSVEKRKKVMKKRPIAPPIRSPPPKNWQPWFSNGEIKRTIANQKSFTLFSLRQKVETHSCSSLLKFFKHFSIFLIFLFELRVRMKIFGILILLLNLNDCREINAVTKTNRYLEFVEPFLQLFINPKNGKSMKMKITRLRGKFVRYTNRYVKTQTLRVQIVQQ